MKSMINEVVIHGIKYKAVDRKRESVDFSCKDCDIYKQKYLKTLNCPYAVKTSIKR